VRAVGNALGLLKPSGHLLIDRLNIRLPADTSEQITQTLVGSLHADEGTECMAPDLTATGGSVDVLSLYGLQLTKQAAPTFAMLEPVDVHRGKFAYQLAG
jgi:hypothetical protein